MAVSQLTKIYREFIALRGVSFSVPRGQVFGLLGNNGAGKTTTLRLLSTLLKPSSGQIQIAGIDALAQPNEVRRKIGIVSGGMSLEGRLSGYEILRFFSRLYGQSPHEFENQLEQISRELELEVVLKKPVIAMSSGMRQKLVIARALIGNPDLLLLDEATRGLDVFARRGLLEFVLKFREAGGSAVYSTHVMSEAEEICDQVGFLHNGELIYIGSIGEAKDRFEAKNLESAFVAAVRSQQ